MKLIVNLKTMKKHNIGEMKENQPEYTVNIIKTINSKQLKTVIVIKNNVQIEKNMK